MITGSKNNQFFIIDSTLILTGKVAIADKIKWIFQKLQDNLKTSTLLSQVISKYQKFKIEFLSLDQDPGLNFGGICRSYQKRICVLDSLDDTSMLATVIFELCNAINEELINLDVCNYLDIPNGQECYAIDNEIAEHQTFVIAKQIYNYGILHANYPVPVAFKMVTTFISENDFAYILSFLPERLAKLFGFYYLDKDLDTNLTILNKKPYVFWGHSHTDYYRDAWANAKKINTKKQKLNTDDSERETKRQQTNSSL